MTTDVTTGARSRRTMLAGMFGALGALAVRAIEGTPAEAAGSVQLGAANTETKPTTIKNTSANADTASALVAASTNGSGLVASGGGQYAVRAKSSGRFAFYNDPGGARVGISATGTIDGGDFQGTEMGLAAEADDRGIQGVADAPSGAPIGVAGFAYAKSGIGLSGSGGNIGVSADGGKTGVKATGETFGVVGGDDFSATGVAGYGTTHGLYGKSDQWGVFCAGNMRVTGTVNPSAAHVEIDHPQDPEHQWLTHALIGAPEALNVYRGTVTLDRRGNATVALPGYFSALNRDASYQLTAIGAAAPNLHVSHEALDNRFGIAGGAPSQKVSWQVTGVRRDAFAAAHPLQVETAKSGADRGTLQYVPKGSNARPMPSVVLDVPRQPAPKVKRPASAAT